MNVSNLIHTAIAAAIMLAIGLLAGDYFAGWCAGVFLFAGREHAQVQARQSLTSWQAWDVRRWPLDSVLDLALPAAVCTTILAFLVESSP